MKKKGIGSGSTETRVTLYADDILVCSAAPEVSIPASSEYLNAFGGISGDTINWGESEFMPFNRPTHWWRFTYLGLKLPKVSIKCNFASNKYWGLENIATLYDWPGKCKGSYSFSRICLFTSMHLFFLKKLLPFVRGYKSLRISNTHLQ